MENREADDVVNSPDAPYLASLASRYALATRYYGVTHPSLPNYLALTGGDTFGIATNCTGCSVEAPNLVDQLEQHHKTWKAYMERLPRACFPGASSGGYVKKHNPFMYFVDIAGNPDRCARVVPLSDLQHDLMSDAVPDFVWITPDLCHSMHDCITWEGDRWLASIVPQIRASRAWANRGVLFIVWDEGRTSAGCCRQRGGGRVALFAISPLSQPGHQVQTPSNHYALLRTIQEAWSLGYLRHSGDAETPVLTDLFQR
jgi:phospholipase C